MRSLGRLADQLGTRGLSSVQSIIDSSPANIAVLDSKGVIRHVNAGWRRLANRNGRTHKSYGIGHNYFNFCRISGASGLSSDSTIVQGIQRLLTSKSRKLSQLYTCRMFAKDQWFLVRGCRFNESGQSNERRLLLVHEKTAPTRPTFAALRDQDERLKEWMESAPFVPWEADAKTLRITYIGPQAQSLLGYPAESWYEPDFWFSHIYSNDRQSVITQYKALGRRRTRRELQYRMVAKDGRIVWVRDTAIIVDKKGEARILRGFFSDVSSEAVLRERETLLRLLSESIDEVFWFVSVNPERLIYISPAVEQIMGAKTDKFYEDMGFWLQCIHEEDRERVSKAYRNWLSGTAPEYKLEFRIVLPDGRIRWMADHGALLYGDGDHLRFATGIAKDITDQKQTEETLRRLSGQLISAQEDERRRISRELHDHVSQTLALLTVELEQLSRDDDDMALKKNDLLAAMQRRLRALSSDIHALSHQLHPAKLKYLGLVSAIRAMCRDVGSAGMTVDFTEHEVPRDLPEDIALTIYRVMQEGLQNVRKHSGSMYAEAELKKSFAELILRISDEGKGFNSSTSDGTEGLGLLSMRERLSSVGGALAISSAPGRGTVIEARIPLPAGHVPTE